MQGEWAYEYAGVSRRITLGPEFDILMYAHTDLDTQYVQTAFFPGTIDEGIPREEVIEQIVDWAFWFRTSLRNAGMDAPSRKAEFNAFKQTFIGHTILIRGLALARKKGNAKREGKAATLLARNGRIVIAQLLGMITADNIEVSTTVDGTRLNNKAEIGDRIRAEWVSHLRLAIGYARAAGEGNFDEFRAIVSKALVHAGVFGRVLNDMLKNRRFVH